MSKGDSLTEKVIGCAIDVHRGLGPGLLESAYQTCLAYELSSSEISFRREHPMPVEYKDVKLDCMKLANISTGLLINFNTGRVVDGIQRFKL